VCFVYVNSGNYSGVAAAAATSNTKPLLLTTTAAATSDNSNTINGYTVNGADSDDDDAIPSWAGVVSGGTATATTAVGTATTAIKPLTAAAKQRGSTRSDSGM
jgi:hypothetical protein